MSREIAEQLSDAIFSAATSQDKFQDMQIDRHFVVSRKTSGVRVTIPANGMTRSYNRDLAIDIAKQIDRAIDAIEDQQE
ncbi:hypothetical protein HED51_02990 [Ochrobactrum grignonense]|nr:hypothetical protein [Brucella grignonensis]